MAYNAAYNSSMISCQKSVWIDGCVKKIAAICLVKVEVASSPVEFLVFGMTQ